MLNFYRHDELLSTKYAQEPGLRDSVSEIMFQTYHNQRPSMIHSMMNFYPHTDFLSTQNFCPHEVFHKELLSTNNFYSQRIIIHCIVESLKTSNRRSSNICTGTVQYVLY